MKRLSTELYLQCCLLNQTPEDEIVYHLVFDIFTKLEYLILNQSENLLLVLAMGIVIVFI